MPPFVDAVPPLPADYQANPASTAPPHSFELAAHVDAAPPARPSAGPAIPRFAGPPGEAVAQQPPRPVDLPDDSTNDLAAWIQPRADHPAEPAPTATSRTGTADQPSAIQPTPAPTGAIGAQAVVPAQRPEPGRVVAPPDQATGSTRVEVRIGRVEVRIVPPPQPVPHAPSPARESRPVDHHALARRYLDRRWY